MSLQRASRVALSALEMQRARMELIASNLANARTTRTAEGGPYRRRLPVVQAVPVSRAADGIAPWVRGVAVRQVTTDPRPFVYRYEPGHPDADGNGFVAYPNVDPAEEMVDMVAAVRAYEANVNVVKTVRSMNDAALEMTR